MNEIKVYKMNDYEWWASKWDKETTNEWYKIEIAEDNDLEEVTECDLDKDGLWDEITDDNSFLKENKGTNFRRIGSQLFEWITFREAIEKNIDFTEPYLIASMEC